MSWYEILLGDRNCKSGCWFILYEEDVIREADGRLFASTKRNRRIEERRVVLREDTSLNETPNAIVYPRSASSGKDHPSHIDQMKECQPQCKIDRPGTVVFRYPCVVNTDKLHEHTWSCEEPIDSELRQSFNRIFKRGRRT